jgi:hypothetical protein
VMWWVSVCTYVCMYGNIPQAQTTRLNASFGLLLALRRGKRCHVAGICEGRINSQYRAIKYLNKKKTYV